MDITNILKIKYPILQGGMAWISEASLAAAVSNAGGLGIIAAGSAPADYVLNEIRKARTKTDKPFGVNIMLLSPYADDIAKIVCEEKVSVVTTGAGSPGKYMEQFKTNGVKVIPVIPSVAIAKKMEQWGADAVVAEGMEAGGHIGKLTTMCLVPQTADAVKIPVIAAGGICDARGVAAALALGAKGVQIGTRFLTAKECTIHDNYKKSVLNAKDIDTVVTGQITGHPVRALKNKFAKQLEKAEKEEMKKETPDIERLDKMAAGSLKLAAIEGDTVNGSIMAGQIAGLVSKEQSAKEIIDELINGL